MTIKKTKANELKNLSDKYDFLNIPKLYTFSHKEWIRKNTYILDQILKKFKNCKVAIRSSSIVEDQVNNSKAGAFKSYLNIELKKEELKKYINKVFKSYGKYNSQKNQILIQKMVRKIALSGVVTNRDLETGAPYYVISYDDFSGKSDTITSGKVIHKTVNIIKGVDQKIIKSLRIRKIYNFIRKIEKIIDYKYIDIELALDKKSKIYLLQIRPISVSKKWSQGDDNEIIRRVKKIKTSLGKILDNKKENPVILSNMSDWNPAEMINDTSYPLALSLYKYLITDETWHTSRKSIGYNNVKEKLLTDFYYHPYININHSLSSFLPPNLSMREKNLLLSKSLNLIKKDNFIHDKIEFEASLNIFDFLSENKFKKIYKNIRASTKKKFLEGLKLITKKNISIQKNSPIFKALDEIEKLKLKNRFLKKSCFGELKIEDNLKLLQLCKKYGTFNFSILARHGFIAEIFLRCLENNILSSKEISLFKSSIKTVSSEITDLIQNIAKKSCKTKFLNSYGHIRQSAYDVESPKYSDLIHDIYLKQKRKKILNKKFKLNNRQKKLIEKNLKKISLPNISAEDFLIYLSTGIKAREYGKLIFTQTLSLFLDNLKKWGKKNNIKVSDINFIDLKTLMYKIKSIKKKLIENKRNYYINKKIILPSIILNRNDCMIVPYRRTLPNFVTNSNISADYVIINNSEKINKKIIQNKIICIKSADPGMDWIFSQNIKGLITLFGGSNSHMAIRCNEHNLPAAIGVGEEIFNRLKNYKLNKINLNCHDKKINLI